MAIVNEIVTAFSFTGDLGPQRMFNKGLASSISLLTKFTGANILSASGLFAFTASVASSLTPLAKYSEELKLAEGAVEGLTGVARKFGGSQDSVISSLQNVQKALDEAKRPGTEFSYLFRRIGISIKDSSGAFKSADTIVKELNGKLSKTNLTLGQQQALLGGLGLDPAFLKSLNMSTEEFNKLYKEGQKYGVMTKDQRKTILDYNDAIKETGDRLSSLKDNLALSLLPTVKDTTVGFNKFLVANSELIEMGLKVLSGVILGSIKLLKRFMPVIIGVAGAFLLAKIATLGFGAALGIVFSPVVLITAGIVTLALIVDDLLTALKGGKSVIADFFMEFFGVDIVPYLQAFSDHLFNMFMVAKDMATGIFNVIADIFKAIWALLNGDFESFWNYLKSALSGFGGLINDYILMPFGFVLELVTEMFSTMFKWLGGLFADIGKMFVNAFVGSVKIIKDLFVSLIEGIKGLWGAGIEYIKGLAMDILPDWAISLLGKASDGVKAVGGAISDGANWALEGVGLKSSSTVDKVTDKEVEARAPVDPFAGLEKLMTETSVENNPTFNNTIYVTGEGGQETGASIVGNMESQLRYSEVLSKKGGR